MEKLCGLFEIRGSYGLYYLGVLGILKVTPIFFSYSKFVNIKRPLVVLVRREINTIFTPLIVSH